MRIRDITFHEDFYDEWDRVPENIKKRFDKKIIMMSNTICKMGYTTLPNSFQAHKAEFMEEPLWIGYVNMGKGGYRVLFDYDVEGCIHFLHILDHDGMERQLNYYIQNTV